ncbi:MAG: LysM peptidoglycan-binding domain-containing protein, partial [Endomicrobiia bacterium]
MEKNFKNKNFIIYFLILLVFKNLVYSQQLSQIQESKEEDILLQEIEVKEGQTLSFIANYYLKDPKRWPEILKYNKLSTSDIYAPLPGMKLKIPIVLVKEKFRPAYLIYILNRVQYRKKGSVDWKDAAVNLELYNDDSIITH